MKWAILLVAVLAALGQSGEAEARRITDAAGRQVDIPDRVDRVLAAGPPASIALYTVAPEKMVGWFRKLSDAEREFVPDKYADLPAHGRITGGGGLGAEALVALRPDVIVDLGTVNDTYASLADRIQAQTGIPYVLVDGAFLRLPQSYRELGVILGVESRANELAAYAERTLTDLKRLIAEVPADRRPRVYYGRGPQGLQTGLGGSINLEVLDAVGAINVAAQAGNGGLTTVSPEQVLSWNPAIILANDSRFVDAVVQDPRFAGLSAVRDRRVYRAPDVPWGWFDDPPAPNRLIGVRWLTSVLYPDRPQGDLKASVQEFFRLFYHVEVADRRVEELLAGSK